MTFWFSYSLTRSKKDKSSTMCYQDDTSLVQPIMNNSFVTRYSTKRGFIGCIISRFLVRSKDIRRRISTKKKKDFCILFLWSYKIAKFSITSTAWIFPSRIHLSQNLKKKKTSGWSHLQLMQCLFIYFFLSICYEFLS